MGRELEALVLEGALRVASDVEVPQKDGGGREGTDTDKGECHTSNDLVHGVG